MGSPDLNLVTLAKSRNECATEDMRIDIRDVDGDGKYILRLEDSGDQLVLNGRQVTYAEYVKTFREKCLPRVPRIIPETLFMFTIIDRVEELLFKFEKMPAGNFDSNRHVDMVTEQLTRAREYLNNFCTDPSKESELSFHLKSISSILFAFDQRWDDFGSRFYGLKDELNIIKWKIDCIIQPSEHSQVLIAQAKVLLQQVETLAAKRSIKLEE